MKISKSLVLTISSIIFLLFSCYPYGYRYNQGKLPTAPVNLLEFNSEFDDYNSDAPTLGWLIPFASPQTGTALVTISMLYTNP